MFFLISPPLSQVQFCNFSALPWAGRNLKIYSLASLNQRDLGLWTPGTGTGKGTELKRQGLRYILGLNHQTL